MAEKRISELTAKGSNLQSTDLIEVSVDAGGGAYNTRYITGAQITAAVSSVNLYNSNGTLTGNRTVTGGGYSLKFTGQSTFSVVSPSASSLDTAFAVRNNTDTTDLINIDGTGVARFYQNLYSYSTNFMETIRSPYFPNTSIQISTAIKSYARGEVGFAYTGHEFDTFDTLTTAGCKIASFANGGSIKWSINKDGVINCPAMPTSSAGLSAGDLWSDSGTIKIV